MTTLILLCLSLVQTEISYKAEQEFSVKFVLMLKKRPEVPAKDWEASRAKESPDSNSPLPFLQASLEVLTKQDNEVKLKIVRDNDEQVLRKKIRQNVKETIFAEYVDDIKDEISGYTHTIYFLNADGDAVSRIVIEFDEEGFYLVNGKKKGKL